jgi:S-formylglutathione hydrolase FrmB
MKRSIDTLVILPLVILLMNCNQHHSRTEHVEREETAGSGSVAIRSVDFYSEALRRSAHYLIALPPGYTLDKQRRFPVLFLLHGFDGTSTDWIEKGNLNGCLQSHHLIVVMPDAGNFYYTNAALRPSDRYEDFIVQDLQRDVDDNYRTLTAPDARGIAGISMGGYGAVKIGLRHPEQFAFAGAVSASFDVTRRSFTVKRLGQSLRLLRIFGPGSAQQMNDVFYLTRQAQTAPYIYVACGTNEALLPVNRAFARLLGQRGLKHEYHEVNGGHSWDHWTRELPALLDAAELHLLKPQL